MLKNDLTLRNPLRLLGTGAQEVPPKGGFGAILARAGVGKTALMVQIALSSLLQNRNVLHVSLRDSVSKVSLWYEEVFRNVGSRYDVGESTPLWESILTHRFIMTFQAEGFTVKRLQDRMEELSEQGIFFPQMILIDGLPFDGIRRETLETLKDVAERHALPVWLTVRTHREEVPDANGFPPQLQGVEDLFHAVVELKPVADSIHIVALKGGTSGDTDPAAHLQLDPATMLVMDTPRAA